MVSNLQTTMIQKNVALSHLKSKSPGLKKCIQPRLAYRYSSVKGAPSTHRDVTRGGSAMKEEYAKNPSQLSIRKKNILNPNPESRSPLATD
jgi:hypothetical protein